MYALSDCTATSARDYTSHAAPRGVFFTEPNGFVRPAATQYVSQNKPNLGLTLGSRVFLELFSQLFFARDGRAVPLAFFRADPFFEIFSFQADQAFRLSSIFPGAPTVPCNSVP
jgi:hypothetical protein